MIRHLSAQMAAGYALAQMAAMQESEQRQANNSLVTTYSTAEEIRCQVWEACPVIYRPPPTWVAAPAKVQPRHIGYPTRPVRSKSGPFHR